MADGREKDNKMEFEILAFFFINILREVARSGELGLSMILP